MSRKEQKQAAEKALVEMGAERLKAENRFGETKTGWWLDTVFLGPLSDPVYCLNVVKGGR